MMSNLKTLYPDKSREELKKYINQATNKKNMVDPTIDYVNNYKNTKKETTLFNMTDSILKNEPIISGYGTLFKNHDEGINLIAEMLNFLLSERKVEKGKLFEAIQENDELGIELHDRGQKTLKLLA
jgi:hypothetical protein